MLKAISDKILTNTEGKLDICAFMRSKEISEHMRKYEAFSIEDKIFIILKSMNPYHLKLKALKILSKEQGLSENEKRLVLYVAKYAETLLNEIYSPKSQTVIGMTEYRSFRDNGLNAYQSTLKERNCTAYYMSYEEFAGQHNKYIPKENEPLPRYEIDLVYPGKPYDINNPICCSATWFDGKIEIYSITADTDWGKEQGFKHSIADYFWCGNMRRYSLPFPTMSKIKLQTPFMREALTGILESEADTFGCWYHFFYVDDRRGLTGSFMDLSCHSIDFSSDFTVFDWVSSL